MGRSILHFNFIMNPKNKTKLVKTQKQAESAFAVFACILIATVLLTVSIIIEHL